MDTRITILIVLVVIFLASIYLSGTSQTMIEPFEPSKETGVEESETEDDSSGQKTAAEIEEELECFFENVTLQTVKIRGNASVKLPAIDNEGNGVVTWLTVDVMPGKGRTLTDINQLLFWIDTQYSIQIAKAVAVNHTKMNLTNVDIVYTIDTEASLVEGMSAGAGLTVATVAALTNKAPAEDVMITGTINTDGTIGPVGGILEKATAAKDVGATVFLVPPGQSTEITYKQDRKCEKIGPVTYCTTDYVPVKTDIEAEVGIDIEEVSTISEALKYFLD